MSDLLKGIQSGVDTAKLQLVKRQADSLQRAAEAVKNRAGKEVPPEELQRMEQAATEFEALMLKQLFSSMWRTVPKEGMLTGSREEELYRDMLNDSLSKEMAENQSLGLREIVMKELIGSYQAVQSGPEGKNKE